MSTKTSTQPNRRTPLSLSGATSKQQQQQNQHQQSSNSRNENKATTSIQKTEQATPTTPTQKDNKNNSKQQTYTEKKTQQQNSKIASNNTSSTPSAIKKSERNEEKKVQNGAGTVNVSNGNSKDKPQNGKEDTVNENTKEKVEKNVSGNVDKKEKKKEQGHEQEKDKEVEKDSVPQVKEVEKDNAGKKEKEKENVSKKETEEIKKVQIKAVENENESEKESEPKKPEREPRSTRSTPLASNDMKKQQDEQRSEQNVEVVEIMDISTDEEVSPSPISPTKQSGDHKFETPKKQDEKVFSHVTPNQKSSRSATPSSNRSSHNLSYTTTVRTVTTTTTIDDVEMEPPIVTEHSPKDTQELEKKISHAETAASAVNEAKPTATSTPGKFLSFREIFFSDSPKKVQQIENNKLTEKNTCPKSFSQISGRRSIRPGNDAYTYSYFQNDGNHRESYRRINTELDVTSNTNTSLNVTVGSEVPNNSSFSFFGRGRKRDRTPPLIATESTVDLDLETSPKSPKRARIDMHGFFSAVASPLTLLRSRFSKTSIQSSTPVKLRLSNKLLSAENAEGEEVEVQNVSGVSIEEELEPATAAVATAVADNTATEEITIGNEAEENKELSNTSSATTKQESVTDSIKTNVDVKEAQKLDKCSADLHLLDEKNTKAESISSEGASVAVAKNKKCIIM